MPRQYSLLLVQIGQIASERWDHDLDLGYNDGWSLPVYLPVSMGLLYINWMQNCLYPESIDWPVYDFVCQELAEEDYLGAGSYYFDIVIQNEAMAAQLQAFLLETMNGYLQSSDRLRADDLYDFLSQKEWDVEQVSRAVYDHGCRLSEQGKYEEAAKFFYILRDSQDPYCYNDTYFMLLQLQMRSYLQEGKYAEAKALMGGYTGERREILKAIYAEYCPE